MAATILLGALVGTASTEEVHPVSRWAQPALSSSAWESHPARDPRTGDIWFVRSDRNFAGWRLWVSRCGGGQLGVPQPAPISAEGIEADPWFSSDGGSLYFISTRATGAHLSRDLDIWRARRTAEGAWTAIERLPAPVNSTEAEWFPRPASDGWLYFGSRRPGGFGKDDIWRARPTANGRWKVENAGAGLNSAGAEYEFEPAPDGRWGILSTSEGLFMVERKGGSWRRAYRFGPDVNANGSEIGPLIVDNGRSFVFSRDLGGQFSGELMIASLRKVSKRTPASATGRRRGSDLPSGRCGPSS
ncbi:TolB family protein [Sphingomonas sp. PR090111-T3T-6A]|uniref:TolB family protein n=1 Tax=Sphingomonas sp. PR090111-T3T-6A TaxID=685778 RepID=UPI00138AB4DC|nr:PD40 domain-containing protein [Sphingomonas sp. PR090111-T3T-6A]